jgi:two-component system OmpR family response regulator
MRVLVVEDDKNLREQLASALTDAGYTVDGAADGEEGQFLGETEPYDLVILDLACRRSMGRAEVPAQGRAIMLILRQRAIAGVRRSRPRSRANDYVTKLHGRALARANAPPD